MVNIHFSLLPRWRGAAPVERAILAGDDETGVCLMVVDRALDTGDLYRRETVSIGPDETATELRDRLVRIGTDQLVDALSEGLGEPVPQEGDAVYAAKISSREVVSTLLFILATPRTCNFPVVILEGTSQATS